MSATNSQLSDSQPIPAIKRRKSIKPPVIQSAVMAKYINGESKSQIANDLGIARNTISAILNASEIEQVILQGRSDCVRYIPKSINVIGERLEKGSETAALAILRGTNVLMNQALTVNQNNIQANTWITMRAQRNNEDTQLATAEPITIAPNDKPTDSQ